jgi:outer membrane scaffolding protein for murein synthesis (MipA/OmpV family)
MKKILAFALLLFVLLPISAFSQTPPSDDYTLIGAGVRARPAYDGSKSQRGDLVPLIDYDGKLLFARTTQGILEAGAHYKLGEGFKLGAQLAYEEGRKTRESPLLQRLGASDVGVGASLGPYAEWETKIGPAPVLALGRVRQQVETSRGAQADLRATVGVYQNGPALAGIYAQATWANQKSLRTYYGRPGFAPDGGLLFASLGALGSYDLGRKWALLASVEARRLQGDAARSPLVERRSNYYAVAGLAYKF